MDQLKAEIDTLKRTLEGAKDTHVAIESTNAEWFQIGLAQEKVPGLVSMVQVVVEHLDQLERSAERHRVLSHEHMRNGDTRMSMRAKTIGQYEDRLRNMLFTQLKNAWNDAVLFQDETA